MPKLPNIGFRKLLKILEREGFVVDHITGSHYILYRSFDGARVTVPIRRKDFPKGTIHAILKSAGLTTEEL